jgi:hypothetical protein
VLLVKEIELALVERAESVLPGDLLQVLAAVSRKVEQQAARTSSVVTAWNRRGFRVPGFGPLADHVMVRRHQTASGVLFVLLGRGDLLLILVLTLHRVALLGHLSSSHLEALLAELPDTTVA